MSVQGEAAAEVTAAAAEDIADDEAELGGNIADANTADGQGDAAPDAGDGEVDEPGEIAPRLDQVDTEIYELLLRSITDEDDKVAAPSPRPPRAGCCPLILPQYGDGDHADPPTTGPHLPYL